MSVIRSCVGRDRTEILAIINAAAEAYQGVIPPDCWHEPYMANDELDREIAAGVRFFGYETDGTLLGIMGLQRVHDVDLLRHAYVRPTAQRHGVGSVLLEELRPGGGRRLLVGTWADASWAIDFYKTHGFDLIAREEAERLMRSYWRIPLLQLKASVVLASRPPQE